MKLDGKEIVAITGSRDLGPGDEARIEMAMAECLDWACVREIRFGGARGADTVALRAAHDIRGADRLPRLVVIVPNELGDQPRDAVAAAQGCADVIVELELGELRPSAFHARNRNLIEGHEGRRLSVQAWPPLAEEYTRCIAPATGCLGFWNGGRGGTSYTLLRAKAAGLLVGTVLLGPTSTSASGPSDFLVCEPYEPASVPRERGSWTDDLDASVSTYVRRTASGRAGVDDRWANHATRWLESVTEAGLRPTIVVPVPPLSLRGPVSAPWTSHGHLYKLSEFLSRQLGAWWAPDLHRIVALEKDNVRSHYTAQQHCDSMAAEFGENTPRVHSSVQALPRVLVVTGVVITGNTLRGAMMAVQRAMPKASVTGAALTSCRFWRN